MTPDGAPSTASQRTFARQMAGFLASGLIALAVDMGVTSGLTRLVGVSPYLSRPVGISLAMVAAWACHRRLTFAVAAPPTVTEFARYATVAWTVAALNYAIYVGLLAIVPALMPEASLVVASVIAMAVSFLGMKFGVFTRP